ncbi:DUF1831 domain-containing protein [Loigolactobacillus iwatensis]|uniref:DUF1831 domain-containing protein n=1 Tax=Loigolactobacillus iwatensis TaxID=1267156 RepID=UPI000F7F8076|nr:DUF1831 domain-containing protein [Loigolactobacillus iwatensis]
MAFLKTDSVKGDSTVYELSSEVKRYTLRDVGFMEKKNGSFTFARPLDPTAPVKQAIKLKITVAKDLSGFTMSVTTANGLQPVDIFKRQDSAEKVEQFNFIVADLIERKVIQKKI